MSLHGDEVTPHPAPLVWWDEVCRLGLLLCDVPAGRDHGAGGSNGDAAPPCRARNARRVGDGGGVKAGSSHPLLWVLTSQHSLSRKGKRKKEKMRRKVRWCLCSKAPHGAKPLPIEGNSMGENREELSDTGTWKTLGCIQSDKSHPLCLLWDKEFQGRSWSPCSFWVGELPAWGVGIHLGLPMCH